MRAYLVIFAVCSCAIGWLSIVQSNYCVDDGYIYAVFARQIAETGVWTFNTGAAPVASTTSPLWTMALAMFIAAGVDASFGIHALHFASVVALAMGVSTLLRAHSLGIRIATALLTASNAVVWTSVGLDVPLAVALVAWAIVALDFRRVFLSGLIFGLGVLARPDTLAVGPVLLLAHCMRARAFPFAGLIGSLVPLGPWLAYAYVTFGSIVPLTLHVKTVQRSLPGWSDTAPFLSSALHSIPSPAIVVGLSLAFLAFNAVKAARHKSIHNVLDPSDWPALQFASYGLLHGAAYTILDVPEGYFWYRIPLVLAITVFAILGLSRAYREFRPLNPLLANGVAFLAVTAVFAASTSAIFRGEDHYRLSRTYRAAATFISERALQSDTIAATEIGYIGFFSNREIVDIHGLIHPEALARIRDGDSLWWLDRSPDWIVLHPGRWFGEPGFRGQVSEVFDRAYVPVAQLGVPRDGVVEIWRRSSSR